MADAGQPGKVLPFVGLLIADDIGADEVIARVSTDVFDLENVNGPHPFDYTDYYEPEMGKGLKRYWALGKTLVEADKLVMLKLAANELEREFAVDGRRRVNADPGYIKEFAVVAATCKTLPAAVYIAQGVYGYLLFIYRSGTFEFLDWTYPEYRDHAGFFNAGRRRLYELRK